MIDQTGSLTMLTLKCSKSDALRLATVLQSGFLMPGTEGESIHTFLKELPGFTEDYLAIEVQTIFYNGDALDNLDTELAGPGATIALGSAMPGLAGAIMKKGSPCGALRKSRTAQDSSNQGDPVEVRTKLFNTVARDRGPCLLENGVRIDARDLRLFLELRPGLLGSFSDVTLDDTRIHSNDLIEALLLVKQLKLVVHL